MVRAVRVLLRLGERGGAGLAVLAHAVVEEAIVGLGQAITVILGKMRGELGVEVHVDGVGQVGERSGPGLTVFAVGVGKVAEIVQVEVD